MKKCVKTGFVGNLEWLNVIIQSKGSRIKLKAQTDKLSKIRATSLDIPSKIIINQLERKVYPTFHLLAQKTLTILGI